MRHTEPLNNIMQTGAVMGALVLDFHDDVLPFSHLTLREFFDFVKFLAYKPDPCDAEFVSRPLRSINEKHVPCDCDDKCVIVGSYMFIHRIPFRFIAVQIDDGISEDYHHVFPEICLNEKWITFDATFPWMLLGRPKREIKRVCLFSWCPSSMMY